MRSKNASHKYVGVIGAGRFGTAVANLLACNTDVLLYVHKQENTQSIQQTRTASDFPLASNITLTYSLAEIAAHCTVIFPIIPSAEFRNMIKQLAPWLRPHHMLIHGTKGLDVCWPKDLRVFPTITRAEVKTMSEVIQEESMVRQVGCIAGPNLAQELAQRQPAATVIASASQEVIAQGQQLLQNDQFHVYSNTDLLGVELCGALKNVIAIGTGCLGGLGYGENSKSFLISRGVVEMAYIGRAMGAGVRPFVGLAGVGDLIATCTSNLSRNYTLGYQLAKGTFSYLRDTGETIEGVSTVKTLRSLIDHYQMRAPITEMLYHVLFNNLSVKEAFRHFMASQPNTQDVDFL